GETPWAENTVRAPSGTSLTSSTNTAPRSVSRSTTCLLWTICLRTYTGGPCKSSARSTVCTARSTPAQYPRGAASSSISGTCPMDRSLERRSGPASVVRGDRFQQVGELAAGRLAARRDELRRDLVGGGLVAAQDLARHRGAVDLVGPVVDAGGPSEAVHRLQRQIGGVAQAAVGLERAVHHV